MTAPVFTPLPTPPDRDQSPETFSSDADAFLGALPTFQTEGNTLGTFCETQAANALSSANDAAASAALAEISLAGTVVIASQAEAEAGTDNVKVMTPLRVAQASTASLASQAEAEAGTDNTKVMTPLRVKESVVANTPPPPAGYTDAQARAAQAGHSAGGVGSYAFLSHDAFAVGAAGSTFAGSALRFGNASGTRTDGTPSGTWRLMGRITANTADSSTSLFLRIS